MVRPLDLCTGTNHHGLQCSFVTISGAHSSHDWWRNNVSWTGGRDAGGGECHSVAMATPSGTTTTTAAAAANKDLATGPRCCLPLWPCWQTVVLSFTASLPPIARTHFTFLARNSRRENLTIHGTFQSWWDSRFHDFDTQFWKRVITCSRHTLDS